MAIFLSFYFSQQQQTMLVTWSCSNVQSTWERAKTKSRKNTWMSFNVPRYSVQCTLEWNTSKRQTWKVVCDPRATHSSIFVFYQKPLQSSFHTSFHCIASILGVTSLTRFRRSGQRTSCLLLGSMLTDLVCEQHASNALRLLYRRRHHVLRGQKWRHTWLTAVLLTGPSSSLRPPGCVRFANEIEDKHGWLCFVLPTRQYFRDVFRMAANFEAEANCRFI